MFRLWMIIVTAAVSPARADGGGERRAIAAAAPAAGAIPVQPLQERKAVPVDDSRQDLEIRGNVVDIETGRTITNYFLQDGEPDPNAPGRINWGAGESRQYPNFKDSLHHTYTNAGEWSRVIAPGYLPEPLTEKPYDGKPGSMKVVVKLRRGWKVGGRVLDSFKKPVAGASVFLVGGSMNGPNITGGKAWIWPETFMRTQDNTVLKTATDGDGRFLLACDATGRFKTPRLSPGAYVIVAEGYKEPSSKQTFGVIGSVSHPDYRAIGDVTVPEQGPAPRVRMMMRPNRPRLDEPDDAN